MPATHLRAGDGVTGSLFRRTLVPEVTSGLSTTRELLNIEFEKEQLPRRYAMCAP